MEATLLIDRPGLAACLQARGVALVEELSGLVIGPAAELAQLRRRFPAAAILAIASDASAEATALEADADDAASAGAPDALIAARVVRLLVAAGPGTITLGDLTINRLTRAARRAGCALRLLPREFALLEQLAARAGATVTRAELHRLLCGLPFDPGTNVLAVHVSRLRAALDRGQAFPMLHTTRGVGYRLVAEPGGAG